MSKTKTGTITFHASHNYGSMLQAYALQWVLTNELNVDNEIINFRSQAQKDFYQSPAKKKMRWKDYVLKFTVGEHKKELTEKYNLFEKFIKEYLVISKELSNEEEVAEYAKQFDFLISGSDQIWNTHCIDFSWAYFLPFASKNAIAYAPSMGPNGMKRINESEYPQIQKCLQNYKAISVREEGTNDVVKAASSKDAEILIDPTLMVDRDQWDKLSGTTPIIEGDYIFMYHPYINYQLCDISKKISSHFGLPVIISNRIHIVAEIFNKFTKKMQYKLESGPIEFLNLIKNAKYVISGSFHAVVFSIIFNKPFIAYGGKTDKRMIEILKSTELTQYGVNSEDYMHAVEKLDEIDFSKVPEYLARERKKSLQFLQKALKKE